MSKLIKPPSIQMPQSPGGQDSKRSDTREHSNINSQHSESPSQRALISAPRMLIISGSFLLILLGVTIGSLHGNWLQISTATGVCLIIWWAIAWHIRELPISAKSRELDVQLVKARQKAENANRAKTRFLATASHEMRTPLNGILGMAKLLDNTRLNPEQANYNSAIKSSGEALFSFVEDMLDITRVETGHFALNPGPLIVRQELEEVCELLAPRAHEKMLEIACICEPDVPQNILIDGRALRQILINLAGNAIKFTQTGGVTLRAGTFVGDDNQPGIRFIVADSGPGIADEDKKRIFDEFERADIDITRKYSGVGLGLAISKAIIGEMKGTLRVLDNKASGVGTLFVAEIPLAVIDDQPVLMSDSSAKLAGRNFLLVSEGNMEFPIIAEMIEHSGGAARQVKTIDAARAALIENIDQTVIIDELMLADDMQCLSQFIQHTKIVILLHPSRRGNLKKYSTLGYASYLIRPARQGSLLSVLLGEVGFDVPANEELLSAKSEFRIARKNKHAKKILLVEDNAINSLLARSVLEKNGHEVHLASNGAIAVTMMQAESNKGKPFAVIYMDLHMPVMDGLTAIGQIRAYEKSSNLHRVRIIALSADEQEQTRADAASAGVDGFLAKPIDPELLMKDANKNAQIRLSQV
ncbi:MAG: response regulator [Rhizobiaceae bacterium]|nr:response regulator [Rhizobiaceae bacterium]